jgi:ATP-dependent Clp protease ATP-binding subunit ClpB
MNFKKFTIKAQEAIQEAANIALAHGQQVIEPAHIMGGVLKSNEQIVSYLLQKTGSNANRISDEVQKILASLPKVSGGEPYLSRESNKVLTKAEEIAKAGGDEFVAIEPILLALLEVESNVSAILKNNGVYRQGLEKAIQELRQGSKVTSPTAEESYQALDKYAINLNSKLEASLVCLLQWYSVLRFP